MVLGWGQFLKIIFSLGFFILSACAEEAKKGESWSLTEPSLIINGQELKVSDVQALQSRYLSWQDHLLFRENQQGQVNLQFTSTCGSYAQTLSAPLTQKISILELLPYKALLDLQSDNGITDISCQFDFLATHMSGNKHKFTLKNITVVGNPFNNTSDLLKNDLSKNSLYMDELALKVTDFDLHIYCDQWQSPITKSSESSLMNIKKHWHTKKDLSKVSSCLVLEKNNMGLVRSVSAQFYLKEKQDFPHVVVERAPLNQNIQEGNIIHGNTYHIFNSKSKIIHMAIPKKITVHIHQLQKYKFDEVGAAYPQPANLQIDTNVKVTEWGSYYVFSLLPNQEAYIRHSFPVRFKACKVRNINIKNDSRIKSNPIRGARYLYETGVSMYLLNSPVVNDGTIIQSHNVLNFTFGDYNDLNMLIGVPFEKVTC